MATGAGRMMSVESVPPVPKEIQTTGGEWQVVRHKNRRRELSPIPPSPPPLRPELAERMWHKSRTGHVPVVETAKTLRAVRDFNRTPTMANYRDKRVDRNEDSHRSARAKVYERKRRESDSREEERRALPPPTSAMDHRQGMDQVTRHGHRPRDPSVRDTEMRSMTTQDPVLPHKSGKAQSVGKSLIKSVRSKHGYSSKAIQKIKKSLASGSKKAQTVISRHSRAAGGGNHSGDGSWDDRRVGAWATGHSVRADQTGDVDEDTIMGEAMEFDVISYPPLDLPQNMNALTQHWGELTQRVCQMAVSDCDSNSSSASVLSDSEAESRCSTPGLTDQSDQEGDDHDFISPPAAVNHLEEVPAPVEANILGTPLWVELTQGFNTQGQRVCWAPASLKQRIGSRTGTVPKDRLRLLENYELAVETNIRWLNKGIRCEKLDPYRQEFQGPAALLTVFREHECKPGSPFHMNVQGPIRIGKLNPRPKAGPNPSD